MAFAGPPFVTPEIVDFLGRLGWAYRAAGVGPEVPYTSWWRSPRDNARVGGHPNSQHLSGLAVDIASRAATAHTRAFIRAATRAGLSVVNEGDHWHIQRFAVSAFRGLCCGVRRA